MKDLFPGKSLDQMPGAYQQVQHMLAAFAPYQTSAVDNDHAVQHHCSTSIILYSTSIV